MKKLISAQRVTFSYSGNKRLVLKDCSMELGEGEILTILGPNGAGKSTLLNCLCGLLSPSSGEIMLNGTNISKMSRKSIASFIGYVQQYQRATFNYSVFDYVLMGRAPNVGLFQRPSAEDLTAAHAALKAMAIEHMADDLITEISGGERQLASIARVIAQRPQVILFDEPTSHLDYGNQIKTLSLIKALKQKGFAIILTTHTPDHCMMLEGNVAILDRCGALTTGKYDEIVTVEKLQEVYEAKVILKYLDDVKRTVCIPAGI